ncbi:MAG TPA: 50S ribosomal protein L3, partial [Oligoflexia bacterium]|nr:50S ribosomal protein L3 [Oligoflexia bacterium]
MFDDQGESVPVTVLELPPNVVYQVKTDEREGYKAIQIGVGQQKSQRVAKPLSRHCAKAKKGFPKFLREVRLDRYFPGKEFAVGDEVTLDRLFEVGSRVDVVGVTVGKGFQGVIKRHHMKGAQTDSHGTHEYFRHGGSIGNRKSPGKVFKLRGMPGHMGHEQVMQLGVKVVAVRPEENLLL